jgi:hypothetical protein
MIDLATAILAINPSAKVIIYEEDINTIDWGETTPISNEDILAKQTELQTAYDAKEYQRKREKEYPSIQEQLDMQYWDKVNGTSTWQDAIAKVKSDNPKE